MFISSNRNVVIPSPDGSVAHPIPKGYVGNVPDWVGETAYFRALVKDGKISVPDSRKDSDVEKGFESEDREGRNRDARKERERQAPAPGAGRGVRRSGG